jgi:competence ComEA-like helix-hairpin-helix protein
LLAFAIWFALSGLAMAAVNINTATKQELTSIKRTGEKRAQDIIDYRTKNGNFKSVDDLEKYPEISRLDETDPATGNYDRQDRDRSTGQKGRQEQGFRFRSIDQEL